MYCKVSEKQTISTDLEKRKINQTAWCPTDRKINAPIQRSTSVTGFLPNRVVRNPLGYLDLVRARQ